jgi:hypothetical protein
MSLVQTGPTMKRKALALVVLASILASSCEDDPRSAAVTVAVPAPAPESRVVWEGAVPCNDANPIMRCDKVDGPEPLRTKTCRCMGEAEFRRDTEADARHEYTVALGDESAHDAVIERQQRMLNVR